MVRRVLVAALILLAPRAFAARPEYESVATTNCWSVDGTTTTFQELRSYDHGLSCEWWSSKPAPVKASKKNRVWRRHQDSTLVEGSCAALIEQRKKGGAVCATSTHHFVAKKPAIYLYPKEARDVEVRLDFHGALTATRPAYDRTTGGWTVKASPDGRLLDRSGTAYDYLFWEGIPARDPAYDFSRGFVVSAGETDAFLRRTLPALGLVPHEYEEFIAYWRPILSRNPWNLIHFAGDEYARLAELDVTPKPDSVLRVFMVYRPLAAPVKVAPQELKPFKRTGFAVVEWGGGEQP